MVNKLPNNLTYLTFTNSFNQSVDNLPNSIRYLKFGLNFNQKIDNLPKRLEYLELDCSFNQTVSLERYKYLKEIKIVNANAKKRKKLFINKPNGCIIINIANPS